MTKKHKIVLCVSRTLQPELSDIELGTMEEEDGVYYLFSKDNTVRVQLDIETPKDVDKYFYIGVR